MKTGRRDGGVGLRVMGLLMPTGILMEAYPGAPPIVVRSGAAAMTASVAMAGALSRMGWEASRT